MQTIRSLTTHTAQFGRSVTSHTALLDKVWGSSRQSNRSSTKATQGRRARRKAFFTSTCQINDEGHCRLQTPRPRLGNANITRRMQRFVVLLSKSHHKWLFALFSQGSIILQTWSKSETFPNPIFFAKNFDHLAASFCKALNGQSICPGCVMLLKLDPFIYVLGRGSIPSTGDS